MRSSPSRFKESKKLSRFVELEFTVIDIILLSLSYGLSRVSIRPSARGSLFLTRRFYPRLSSNTNLLQSNLGGRSLRFVAFTLEYCHHLFLWRLVERTYQENLMSLVAPSPQMHHELRTFSGPEGGTSRKLTVPCISTRVNTLSWNISCTRHDTSELKTS